jgi:hypothetical protein
MLMLDTVEQTVIEIRDQFPIRPVFSASHCCVAQSSTPNVTIFIDVGVRRTLDLQ